MMFSISINSNGNFVYKIISSLHFLINSEMIREFSIKNWHAEKWDETWLGVTSVVRSIAVSDSEIESEI